MRTLKHIILILICVAHRNYVSGVCEVSYIMKCESIQDLLHNDEKKYWSELLIEQDECTKAVSKFSLTRVHLDGIPFLKRLIVLNQLNSVEEFSFSNLSSLRFLNLYGNNLQVIKPSTFVQLDLEEVKLKNNGIRRVESYAFESCKMKVLDLSYNNLTVLQSESLHGCYIIKLILRHNKLAKIEYNALPSYTRSLHFDYNELESFNVAYLNRSHTIEVLSISHNKLLTADLFTHFSAPKIIDLSFNNIHSYRVGQSLLRNRYKIEFVSFAFNHLRMLNVTYVKNAPITWALSGNPWNCQCINEINKFAYNMTLKIRRDPCDVSLTSSGRIPFCVGEFNDHEKCPSEDPIPEEYLQLFQKALPKVSTCNYS
jgi:hypothetical protein